MRAAGLGAKLKREPETMGRGAVPREGPWRKQKKALLRGWSGQGWTEGPGRQWELKPTWWEKCLRGISGRGRGGQFGA